MELRVRRIGYLVPAPTFVGTVQSVYARACNVASSGSLLTILAPGIADAPTTLVLAGDRVVDLRACFRIRDRVVRRGSHVTSHRVDIDLAYAASWQPGARPIMAGRAQIAANLRVAAARLAARIDDHASVVHRQGREMCTRVGQACRERDVDTALL